MRLPSFASTRSLKLASAVSVPVPLAFIARRFSSSTLAMAPSLPSLRTSNAELVGSLPGEPVAVFVGGTSGIGQGMAETFAQWRSGRAHIVIVGRNEAAAKEVISHFPKVPASEEGRWTHEFVKCDATLMKEVKRASDEILARHRKINFLVMSPGYFSSSGRDETEEGIDKKLAVHYYSRWKFTEQLLPALRSAKEQGEEARVLSVFSTGYGGKVNVDDFGLKKNYSMSAAALSATTYNDYMVEVRYHTLIYPAIQTDRTLSQRVVIPRAQSPTHLRPCLPRRRPNKPLSSRTVTLDSRHRALNERPRTSIHRYEGGLRNLPLAWTAQQCEGSWGIPD